VGALVILDDLRKARDAAREKRDQIESAAEGRRIATLALDARSKGKVTLAAVIQRFEEVTRLDPGVHWDWVELSLLHRSAGRLKDAEQAATAEGSAKGRGHESFAQHPRQMPELRAKAELRAGALTPLLHLADAHVAEENRLARRLTCSQTWRRDKQCPNAANHRQRA
jgi:hypothetical protein